jgi:hypothetical protein
MTLRDQRAFAICLGRLRPGLRPFQTVVLGVDVTVTGIDLTEDEQISAAWSGSCIPGATRRSSQPPDHVDSAHHDLPALTGP